MALAPPTSKLFTPNKVFAVIVLAASGWSLTSKIQQVPRHPTLMRNTRLASQISSFLCVSHVLRRTGMERGMVGKRRRKAHRGKRWFGVSEVTHSGGRPPSSSGRPAAETTRTGGRTRARLRKETSRRVLNKGKENKREKRKSQREKTENDH